MIGLIILLNKEGPTITTENKNSRKKRRMFQP